MSGSSLNSVINAMDQSLGFADEAFLKKERDKARKLRSSQWWKRKRSSGICHYCKQSFPPGELTMDHIIPLSRGGRTEKFNVAACCKACNTKKKETSSLGMGRIYAVPKHIRARKKWFPGPL